MGQGGGFCCFPPPCPTTMRKIKGLVLAVTMPTIAHQPGTWQVKLAVPITKGYATEDNGESWIQYDRRVAKTGKRDVFVNFLPQVGQWIEVKSV